MRDNWQTYLSTEGDECGDRNHQAAENLLRSSEPSSLSALDGISSEANTRMRTLRYAYLSLGLALLGTAALGIQQVLTIGGTP